MFERLYIHVPFCQSKCGYCAFYSIPAPQSSDFARYTVAVTRRLPPLRASFLPLKSIFIGGGTPSFLPLTHWQKIATELKAIPRDADFEFTIECNPESLNAPFLELCHEMGVTRISLGVQSLNPNHLNILQRHATPQHILNAFDLIQKFDFPKLSADLIYAIPSQTLNDARDDVLRLLDLGLTHFSAYSLTSEEGARLSDLFADTDTSALASDVWESLPDWVAPYELTRYEVSNYATPGMECMHNLGIWQGDSYYGLGPAATSFDGTQRFTQVADVNAWIARAEPEVDVLSPEKRAAEILMFALRSTFGIAQSVFIRKAFYNFDFFKSPIAELSALNLVTLTQDSDDLLLKPTDKGLAFWNLIAETLV